MKPHLRFCFLLAACLTLPALSACSAANSSISQNVTVNGVNRFEARTVVSDYLPAFRSGQKWVYSSKGTDGDEEVSYEVVSAGEREVIQKLTVRVSGQTTFDQLISLNRYGVPLDGKTRISQHLSFGGGLAGPRTTVDQSVDLGGATGVEVNQSVSQGGTTVSQSVAPLRFLAAGQQAITVPAGSYTADVYRATGKEAGRDVGYTLWLVKGIGEVKSSSQLSGQAEGSLALRELKSFSAGSGANLALK